VDSEGVADQNPNRFDARLTSSSLEHELRLVDEALDAVASGRFPSVTVAGLRFGEELLPRARAGAAGRGLRVRPLFHSGEHGADLVIERESSPETGR
jgi:hypothetical protein